MSTHVNRWLVGSFASKHASYLSFPTSCVENTFQSEPIPCLSRLTARVLDSLVTCWLHAKCQPIQQCLCQQWCFEQNVFNNVRLEPPKSPGHVTYVYDCIYDCIRMWGHFMSFLDACDEMIMRCTFHIFQWTSSVLELPHSTLCVSFYRFVAWKCRQHHSSSGLCPKQSGFHREQILTEQANHFNRFNRYRFACNSMHSTDSLWFSATALLLLCYCSATALLLLCYCSAALIRPGFGAYLRSSSWQQCGRRS